MRNFLPFRYRHLVQLLAVLCFCSALVHADDAKVREIFVPYDDLNVLLENAGRRVFLSKVEYDDLLKKAKTSPALTAPYQHSMLSAEYEAQVLGGRAEIDGKLLLEITADGLHAIPLDLGQTGLRRATLDGKPASINRANGRTILFVEGIGRHELVLNMSVPISIAAARQTISYTLPTAATNRMKLSVPGNVDIKSGATAISRQVDSQNDRTRLELLPQSGQTTLVMSLNNKQLRENQLVNARNVVVSEITETYERLHITSSMNVALGTVRRFRYRIPDGFEVIEAKTQSLSKWRVEKTNDGSILSMDLRNDESGTVIVHILMHQTGSDFANWVMPDFRPLDVASSISVLGLLIEDQLNVQSLQAEGLIPIDVDVLKNTLPPSIFQAEPGAPKLRTVSMYYSPHEEFHLAGNFEKPTGRVDVVSSMLLIVGDSGLRVSGTFSLRPMVDKIFGCNIVVDPNWQIDQVAYQGQPLPFENYTDEQDLTRIRIELTKSVSPGEDYSLHLEARYQPAGWMDEWETQLVEFPNFRIAEAASDRGAIAVQVNDDLAALPDNIAGVVPLDETKKTEFNLASIPTSFAFRFDARPFSASFEVAKVQPKITAQTYSFLSIKKSELSAHYEIVFDIRQARASSVSFALPTTTPDEISIQGLHDLKVKSFASQEVSDGMRQWNVELASRLRGAASIAISFEQSLETQFNREEQNANTPAYDLSLPIMQARDVAYQTGIVAIEGESELDLALLSQIRKVDVGELAGADYQPGRRLLGAYGFVGDAPEFNVRVQIPDGYQLPTAIVQRGELTTSLASGISQTAARFLIRTKAQFLQIELPEASTLWSVFLDQKPSKPQRDGDKLLVSLPTGNESKIHDLQIVFETPTSRVGLRGDLDVHAPKLYVGFRHESQTTQVPLADLNWTVYLPNAYKVTKSRGTVDPVLSHAPTKQYLVDTDSPWSNVTKLFFHSPIRSQVKLSQSQSRRAHKKSERSNFVFDSEAASSDESLDAIDPSAPQDSAEPEPSKSDATTKEDDKEEESKKNAAQQADSGSRDGESKSDSKPAWALQGLRSLKIELAEQDNQIRFQSLGDDPHLDITLVDRQSLTMLANGLGILIFTIGLILIAKPVSTKIVYVFGVAIVATFLPVMLGFEVELNSCCQACILAVLALIPVYLIANCWRSLAGIAKMFVASPVTPAVVLVLLCALVNRTTAEDNIEVIAPTSIPREAILNFELAKPVTVPDDAVIIPYDADNDEATKTAKRVVVPYEKYVQLWNLAYPDKKMEAKPLPADFSFAGAEWKLELAEEDQLEIRGAIDVEIYADKLVSIPVAIDGGVLAKATIDGQPAKLRLVALDQQQQQQHQQQGQPTVATTGLATLLMEGLGRKKLEIAVRYPVARQGGWRSIQGRLPVVASTSLRMLVPKSDTEIRLRGVADQTAFQTQQNDQELDIALATDRGFTIQWRPKVAHAAVDQSLTAESDVMLDIQEDGLRLTWNLQLRFSSSERDFFEFQIPNGYVVEKVIGENIRAWDVNQQLLRVDLLKTASNSQQLQFHLSRFVARSDALTDVEAPIIQVQDAALHEGRIGIRKSPLLNVRIAGTQGLARTDISTLRMGQNGHIESPLGLRPFQAFRFSRTPFEMKFSAEPVTRKLTSKSQVLLRLSEEERSVESRVVIQPEGRPLYNFQIQIPRTFNVDRVIATNDMHWSVTEEPENKLLRIFLPNGIVDELPVIIHGRLGERGPVDLVDLPLFLVQDVTRQESTIVVQTDPSFDAQVEELQNCQTVLLRQTHNWLALEQRRLARVAVTSDASTFAGKVKLVKRTPRVTVRTVSNLSATKRVFEETILFDFQIQEAGIRDVSFLLPAGLRNANLSAPLIRRKRVEEIDGSDQIRILLELQDEVMGQFRVLVSQDSLINSEEYEVAIPTVETGRTIQQFVALESSGRGELTHVSQGVEQLSKQSRQWQTLNTLLGFAAMSAFVVQPSSANPQFVAQLKDRPAVETVNAKIQFAETVLCVDTTGSYRGTQTYQVDNSTEQFLELLLPDNARLWTVLVADEPVKPIRGNGSVRIPLIKTAEGDLDYPVVIRYGGSLGTIGSWSKMQFPLIRTKNINVAESQVRLWLPESHQWGSFDGTMRLVDDESDLLAGFLRYNTNQLKSATESLASANPFTKLRAKANLTRLESTVKQLQRGSRSEGNRLYKELGENTAAWNRAQEVLSESESKKSEMVDKFSNRGRLNELFLEQSNDAARNIVNSQDSNFDQDFSEQQSAEKPGKSAVQFESEWLDKSGLNYRTPAENQSQPNRILQIPNQQQSMQTRQFEGPNLSISPDGAPGPQGKGDVQLKDGRQSEQQVLERFANQLKVQDQSEQAQILGDRVSDETAEEMDGAFLEAPPGEGSATGAAPMGQNLVSLNIDLPTRGVEYQFTTPRGDIQIQASAVDRKILRRLTRRGAFLGIALVSILAFRRLFKVNWERVFHPIFATFFVAVGFLITGIYPMIGGLVVLCGLARLLSAVANRLSVATA